MSTPARYEPKSVKRPKAQRPLEWMLLGLALLLSGTGVATQWTAYRLGFSALLPGFARATPPGLRFALRVAAVLLATGGVATVGYGMLWGRRARRWWGAGLLSGCMAGAAWLYALPAQHAPWDALLWAATYYREAALQPYLAEGLVLGSAFGALLGAALWLALGGAEWQTSESHGSARWGDGRGFGRGRHRIWHALSRRLPGLKPPASRRSESGLPLGWKGGAMHYDRSGLHALVAAPTGSGKTVGYVIPALLLHEGSLVAVDVKRELYHVTRRRRAALNEGRVYRLDPFAPSGGEDMASYNPLDILHASGPKHAEIGDDARMIANMCIIESGNENNPFFVRSARQLLAGLIVEVALREDRRVTRHTLRRHVDRRGAVPDRRPEEGDPNPWRSLVEVRRLLTLPDDQLRDRLRKMARRSREARGGHRLTRALGAQFADMNPKEFTAVVATAREQTFFLDSPAIERAVRTTTFDFRDLKREEASVFLVLPDTQLGSYARWLRLMIACAQSAITSVPGRPEERILFMIDEFPALRRFERMIEGVSLHRSYGIQYVLIVQSLAQLTEHYGESGAANLVGNAQSRIFWAPNDTESAERISKMSGRATVAVEGASQTRKRGGGRKASRDTSSSIRETGRPLVTTGEVLNAPSTDCFVFGSGQRPVVFERPNYLEDGLFAGLYDENPHYSSSPGAAVADEKKKPVIEKAARPETPEQSALARADRAFRRRTGEMYVVGEKARDAFWRLCEEGRRRSGEEGSAAYVRRRLLEDPEALGLLARPFAGEEEPPAFKLALLYSDGMEVFETYGEVHGRTKPPATNGEAGGRKAGEEQPERLRRVYAQRSPASTGASSGEAREED